MSGETAEVLRDPFEARIVINKEDTQRMWSDFQKMGLDMIEHSVTVHDEVPHLIVPLAGGILPTLYLIEGAAQRASKSNLWREICSTLSEQDSQGPQSIVFTVKSGKVQNGDGYTNQYIFSRPVNRSGRYKVVDDIADSLETYRDMENALGEDTEMVTPTCKEKTWPLVQIDTRLYVPESGIIPSHNGKDTWIFGGAGMNRTDNQFPVVSSLQRMSSFLYTHNGDPSTCEPNGDLHLLTAQDKEGGLDPIVYKTNQLIGKDAYVQSLLFSIDEAKVYKKYHEVIRLAQLGFKHIMPRLLQAAA